MTVFVQGSVRGRVRGMVRGMVRGWNRKRRSVPLPRGISSPKRGWARAGAVMGEEEEEAEEARGAEEAREAAEAVEWERATTTTMPP